MKVYYYNYWTGDIKGCGKIKYIAENTDYRFIIRCEDVDRTFCFQQTYSPEKIVFYSFYELSGAQKDKLLRHLNYLKRTCK